MDERRENEATPAKNPTTVERRSERELVVTRTVNGPARLVFEAWSNPELFRQWWVPKSMGMTLYACEMDVRTVGSRLLGNMTFGVGGEVLIVKDVAMRAEPIDWELIEDLTGKPLPYPWKGKIQLRLDASGGPVNGWRVEQGEFSMNDANVPGATARGRGRGEIDMLFPAFTKFHGFDVETKLACERAVERDQARCCDLRRRHLSVEAGWQAAVRIVEAEPDHACAFLGVERYRRARRNVEC